MRRKRRPVETQDRLGHEGRVAGQLENRVSDAAPGALEVCICLVAGHLPGAARFPECAPEHEPPAFDRGDLDEAAEVFPCKRGGGGDFVQARRR